MSKNKELSPEERENAVISRLGELLKRHNCAVQIKLHGGKKAVRLAAWIINFLKISVTVQVTAKPDV